MFGKFIEKIKARQLNKEMSKDPLNIALMECVKENWHEVTVLGSCTQEFTENNMLEFFSMVNTIRTSESPLEELREKICIAVMEYAEYLTLVITPTDKGQMLTKDSKFVTGGVNEKIGTKGTKELTDNFKEIYFNNPDVSKEELIEYANFRLAVLNFYVKGLDLVRIYFEDYNKVNYDKDWLRPFTVTMAEMKEYEHREKLDMPQLMDNMMWIRKSLFINNVRTEKNPLMAYEEALERLDIADS